VKSDVADDGRASPDDNAITYGWVALALGATLSSQGHPVVEQNVVTNNCGFANNDAHAMVNDQATTDLRGWVNFDASEHASVVCPNTGKSLEFELPEQMCLAVIP
jgi:hypothetical protein